VQGGAFTSRAIAYLKGSFAVDPSAPQPTTIPPALTAGVVELSGGTTKQLSADEWFELVRRVFPDGDHLLSEHLFVRRARAWHLLDN
jgi:hypothetical protein